MSARDIAAQTLRSCAIGRKAGDQLVAELQLHARNDWELIGALKAQVSSLSADLAIALLDGMSDHAKAVRLVGDAREIVNSWLAHPVAGDEAGGVHEVLGEALVGLEATFFEAPEPDMPDPEWQGEARAQSAELRLVREQA